MTDRAEVSTGVGVRLTLARLEYRIARDPLTDPALWFVSRFRCHWAWAVSAVATLPVPRRGVAGLYSVGGSHHLVRRSRAFCARHPVSHDVLQLLLYGTHPLLRRFQQRSTLLFRILSM